MTGPVPGSTPSIEPIAVPRRDDTAARFASPGAGHSCSIRATHRDSQHA
jgi:hypothetical protein